MAQPIGMATFDPIQNSGPERPQRRHIIGEECQADRKHPESQDRQEAEQPAKRQQYSHWNPEPATGWLPEEANCRAKAIRQPIYESLQAALVGVHCICIDVNGSVLDNSFMFPLLSGDQSIYL